MLTVNVDVSDGLVNGARGTIEDIIKTDNEVTLLLIKFDHSRVGMKAIAQTSIAVGIHKLCQSADMRQCSTSARTKLLKQVEDNSLLY